MKGIKYKIIEVPNELEFCNSLLAKDEGTYAVFRLEVTPEGFESDYINVYIDGCSRVYNSNDVLTDKIRFKGIENDGYSRVSGWFKFETGEGEMIIRD